MKAIVSLLVLLFLANSVSAQEVPRENWSEAMKTALPTHFCQASQYFRQCFDVTAIECEEVAASATRLCLSDLEDQLPETLVQPRDGTFWGNRLGTCAGTAYEVTLREKRIGNERCNNVNNWR